MDRTLKDFTVNILQWNSQSIRPKSIEFESILFKEQIHIAILSETWLEEDCNFRISGYNIYRKDRLDSYGGVSIITHKSIKTELYNITLQNTGIEIVGIKIFNCKNLKNILSVYCPSSIRTTQSDWDELFSQFSNQTLIAGDFNGHHPNWSCKTDIRGNQILDAALENGFVPINNGDVTRVRYVNNYLQQTSPDITFTSSDIAINFIWSVLSESLNSDHLMIKIKLNYQDIVHYVRRRNFRKANWISYRKDIEKFLNILNNSYYNVQDMYDNFISIINKSAEDNIPFIKICSDPQRNFIPKPYWYTDLSKLVAERRLALSRFRRNPTPNNLAVLEDRTIKAQSEIKGAKLRNWHEFCSSIDETTSSSEMWRKMRWVKGYKQNKHYVSCQKKEELLNTLAPDSVQPPKPILMSDNSLLEVEFTIQELEACLKKKDTAPGDDDVTYSMIFNLPEIGKRYLLKIYNNILNSSYVPYQWRNIKVIPIPKAGTSSDIKLRPISLISCLCKLFHLMLEKRLEWFIEHNKVLSLTTTGFRRGQSCLDSLTQLITAIQIGFTKNSPTLACFIDISNAYNNVLIDKVVESLDNLNVGNKICNYFWEFLTERHLIIKGDLENEGDIMRWTNRGLAQGDPIAPLLFNIVTLEICKINFIQICQYADDFAMFISCNNLSNSNHVMQTALNLVTSMLSKIGLEVSAQKSQFCLFSRGRRKQQLELTVDGVPLKFANNIKYLGIWLDQSLRWGKHINEVCEKTQKFVNLMKVLAGPGWGIHPMHLRHLYISVIRSRFDYGSFLFDNSANVHLSKLDKIQNKMLRIIGSFIKTTPIHVMESELCLPPLYLRRKYLAIKYCLKANSWTNGVTVKLLSELGALCDNRYWTTKKKPGLIVAFNIIKDEHIYSSNPLDIYKLNFWCSKINLKHTIKTLLNCINEPKRCYDANILRNNTLQEICTTYVGWYTLFTDGSKSTGIGAAFYDPVVKQGDCFKIVSKVSIMTAELLAISKALSYAVDLQSSKVVIFTDSKSALQHLARCASGCRGVPLAYAVLRKLYDLNRNSKDLILQWIPSHIGLKGNEEADNLAKLGAVNGTEIYIFPIYSEAMMHYKIRCHEDWIEYFNDKSKSKGIWYKVLQNEPPRIPWFANQTIHRKLLVVAHRIRSGHMPLKGLAYLMRKVDSPNCDTCQKKEDVHHLLVECVRNQSQREIIVKTLKINKLDVGIFLSLLSKPTSREAKMVYNLLVNK